MCKPNIIKHTQHTNKRTCEHTYISTEVPTYLLPCIHTCIPTLQYSISLDLTLPYHAFWYIPLHCYSKLLHSIVTFHSIPYHSTPFHTYIHTYSYNLIHTFHICTHRHKNKEGYLCEGMTQMARWLLQIHHLDLSINEIYNLRWLQRT